MNTMLPLLASFYSLVPPCVVLFSLKTSGCFIVLQIFKLFLATHPIFTSMLMAACLTFAPSVFVSLGLTFIIAVLAWACVVICRHLRDKTQE